MSEQHNLRAQRKREIALQNLQKAKDQREREIMLKQQQEHPEPEQEVSMEEEDQIPLKSIAHWDLQFKEYMDQKFALEQSDKLQKKETSEIETEEHQRKRQKTMTSPTLKPKPPSQQTKQEVESLLENAKEFIKNSPTVSVISSFGVSLLTVYVLTSSADWLRKKQAEQQKVVDEQTCAKPPLHQKGKTLPEETPDQNNSTQDDYNLF